MSTTVADRILVLCGGLTVQGQTFNVASWELDDANDDLDRYGHPLLGRVVSTDKGVLRE